MKTFLIIGKTGVGKSSLINSLFGSEICQTSAYEACTQIIEYYAYSTPWGDIKVIDTPGLCDNDEATDLVYLKLILKNVNLKDIFAVIYVSRLDDNRFRRDERLALKNFTLFLGNQIWSNTILIYTFAANVINRTEIGRIKVKQFVDFIKDLCETEKLPYRLNLASIGLIDNCDSDWCGDDAIPLVNVFQ